MSLAESVRQRLLNRAKAINETFDLVLTHYGLERLLYRISRSKWKKRIFLKGALLFSVWHDSPHRFTRDLDLLGCGFSDMQYVNQMFHSLCEMKVPDDGIEFDPGSIRCSEIREGNVYHGIRVMSQKFDFSGSILCNSIHSTFKRRGINIPSDIPFALTDSFGKDNVKKVQWKAFLRKKKIKTADVEFLDMVGEIREFLMPPLTALQQKMNFNMTWKPFGPWQMSDE